MLNKIAVSRIIVEKQIQNDMLGLRKRYETIAQYRFDTRLFNTNARIQLNVRRNFLNGIYKSDIHANALFNRSSHLNKLLFTL